jgi:hypothetical protein
MNGLTEQRKVTLAFLIGLVLGIGVTWMWYATEPNAADNGTPEATSTPETATSSEATDNEAPANEATSDNDERSNGDTTEQSTENEQQTVSGNGNELSVARQVPGDDVTIASVRFSEAGWVAVHELTDNGERGNVLGAKWEPAGEHSQVTVPLLRGTEGARTYSAVLYRDNGNKEFDLDDDQMIMQDGEPVADQFETMSGAAGN